MSFAVFFSHELSRRLVTAAVLVLLFCATVWSPRQAEAAGPAKSAGTARTSVRKPSVSLEEMAGQMIMTGFRGTGEEPLHEDLVYLLDDIRQGRIGGVILFDRDHLSKSPIRNILSLEQTGKLVAMLQAAAPVPLFVAVDQEGGRVRRFKPEHGVAATPSPMELGRGTPAATRAEALRLGKALRLAGVNLNFAPSLDVNINPKSPAIGALGRAFSANPGKVAAHGRAFAQGLAEAGVFACYKHFPGHGSAAGDTHDGLTDVSSSWRESELTPYRLLLSSAPPAMVMMGHVVLKQKNRNLPASLSREAVSGMLRRDLRWRGVVITDDLQMQAIEGQYSTKEAVRLAVLAGVDILLFGNNLRHDPREGNKVHAALMELVRDGEITPKRIEQSYKRIMKLKAGLSKQ